MYKSAQLYLPAPRRPERGYYRHRRRRRKRDPASARGGGAAPRGKCWPFVDPPHAVRAGHRRCARGSIVGGRGPHGVANAGAERHENERGTLYSREFEYMCGCVSLCALVCIFVHACPFEQMNDIQKKQKKRLAGGAVSVPCS
jgi:hypothetical protein